MLTKTGRILFGLPFAIFGLFHLISGSEMAGFVPTYLPAATFWVYLTGVVMLISGLAIIVGKWYVRELSLLLAFQLLIFIVLIQLPGMMNEETRQLSMIIFLKDIGLFAGALMVAGASRQWSGAPAPTVQSSPTS